MRYDGSFKADKSSDMIALLFHVEEEVSFEAIVNELNRVREMIRKHNAFFKCEEIVKELKKDDGKTNEICMGVMSSKWEMEAPDITNACIAFSLFLEKNIPVAVYEPHDTMVFMPIDILTNNPVADGGIIRDIVKTIKKV